MNPLRAIALALLALLCAAAFAQGAELPRSLRDTGLYAQAHGGALHADVVAFSPQYPLWSDGADKQRWIRLPARHGDRRHRTPTPGCSRSAPGCGRRSRTAAGRSRRATSSAWPTAAGASPPMSGMPRAAPPSWPRRAASHAGRRPARPAGATRVPSRGDCLACHGGATVPVLGLTALQLSPERDPNAVHGRAQAGTELDLRELVERGLCAACPRACWPSRRASPRRQPPSAPRWATCTPTAPIATTPMQGGCRCA